MMIIENERETPSEFSIVDFIKLCERKKSSSIKQIICCLFRESKNSQFKIRNPIFIVFNATKINSRVNRSSKINCSHANSIKVRQIKNFK